MMFFVLMIVVACASPESKIEKISFNDKTVEYTGKTQKISIKDTVNNGESLSIN